MLPGSVRLRMAKGWSTVGVLSWWTIEHRYKIKVVQARISKWMESDSTLATTFSLFTLSYCKQAVVFAARI